MSDYEKDRHLDELLDSALAQYSSVEPRPGLETRILASVRAATSTMASRRGHWRWLWAGAVAAIALVTFVLLANRHSVVPKPGNNVVQAPQPPVRVSPRFESSVPVPPSNTAKRRRETQLRSSPQPVALDRNQRPSVFPTPSPLSEQEKMALAYAARAPKEELIAQMKTPDSEEEEFWADGAQVVSAPQPRTTR
jgi:hypothetical protein